MTVSEENERAIARTVTAHLAGGLALAQEISAGTIEKVLDKSDLELGIEALIRMTSPPKGK